VNNLLYIILVSLIFSANTFAQQIDSSSIVLDTLKTKSEIEIQTKSPTGALLRGALIPGWGQIYNESYWQVPIFWGVTAGLLSGWFFNNAKYEDNADLYSRSLIDPTLGVPSNYLNKREFYRDQRDLFAIYIGLTYLLNLIDAYVDAHLFDFNVSETDLGQKNISIKLFF